MQECTVKELITELGKPGRALVCIQGTEISVEIKKLDLIRTLEPLVAMYGSEKLWMFKRYPDGSMRLEANR